MPIYLFHQKCVFLFLQVRFFSPKCFIFSSNQKPQILRALILIVVLHWMPWCSSFQQFLTASQEVFFHCSHSCLSSLKNNLVITNRDKDPRCELSNVTQFHCVLLCVCVFCVCVHRQGSHFYKHPPKSNGSQNPHLLEKVMKKVI